MGREAATHRDGFGRRPGRSDHFELFGAASQFASDQVAHERMIVHDRHARMRCGSAGGWRAAHGFP